MDIKDAKTIRMIKMDPDKYVDLIVSPEGEVINAGWGHVIALRRIMGITEDELCNMVAIEDSPIMWLIEKTGYMTISKKYSFSMAITDKQKEAYDILVHEKDAIAVFPRASMADRRIRLSDDDAADRGEGKVVS